MESILIPHRSPHHLRSGRLLAPISPHAAHFNPCVQLHSLICASFLELVVGTGAMAAVATTLALCALALASSSSRTVASPSSFVCRNAAVAVPGRVAIPANATKVGARCRASEKDQGTVTQRDVFVGLSASVMAAGIWTSIQGSQEAQTADLIQRQQRGIFFTSLKNKLREEIVANPEIIPDLLRLALNDALTYDKCSAELRRPENRGLEKAISFLENVKKTTDEAAVTKGGPILWVDLIHIAGMFYREPLPPSVSLGVSLVKTSLRRATLKKLSNFVSTNIAGLLHIGEELHDVPLSLEEEEDVMCTIGQVLSSLTNVADLNAALERLLKPSHVALLRH